MTDSVGGGQGGRLAWIDFAKGASITLVVLYHIGLLLGRIAPDAILPWSVVSTSLAPIRMPLFFLISGYLSAKLMERPLTDSLQRTFGLLLLNCFWTALFTARLAIPEARNGYAAPSAEQVVLEILLPTSFWYLWALPALHLAAWLSWQVARERMRLIILVLFVLSFFGPLLEHETLAVLRKPLDDLKAGSILLNAVWFFAGIHYRGYWAELIAKADLRRLAISGLLYAAAVALAFLAGGKAILHLQSAIALASLAFAANGLGLMSYTNVPARFMAWIGTRTLPVYVFHTFGIAVVSGVIKVGGLRDAIRANAVVIDLIAAPLLCLILVAASRLAADLCDRIGLKALIHPMRLPRRLRAPDPTSA